MTYSMIIRPVNLVGKYIGKGAHHMCHACGGGLTELHTEIPVYTTPNEAQKAGWKLKRGKEWYCPIHKNRN